MQSVEERRAADLAAGESARTFLQEVTTGGPKTAGKAPLKGSPPPTDLEIEVRTFLSSFNRHERRQWLAHQLREAGKIRKKALTQ
jgi:hypothetical protein